MWTINLKENAPPLDVAIAQFEIELERAKFAKERAIKVLHGYGSHGRGGAILLEIRKLLAKMKKEKAIEDFFFGDRWNSYDKQTSKLLMQDKGLSDDEDLNKSNPGITIIVLKQK